MATATYGAFQVGPNDSCFKLELVYDTGTLAVLQAVVSNTTDEDELFHLGDADAAAPVWTSDPVSSGTLTDTQDLSTTPGYSLVSTPRGPRPRNCGTGAGS